MQRLTKTPDHILDSLTVTEKNVFDYIVENLESVVDFGIIQLSQATFCSPATIVSLLKKLGYSGYSEFKYKIKEQSSVLGGDVQAIEKKDIVDKNVKQLEKALQEVDVMMIDKLAQDLLSGQEIIVIASSITAFVAQEFCYKMQMLGCNILGVFDKKLIAPLLKNSKFVDTVIIFSMFGNTQVLIDEVCKISPRQKKYLITTNPTAFLNKYVDNVILAVDPFEKDEYAWLNSDFDIHSRLPLAIISKVIVDMYLEKKSSEALKS